MSENLTSHPKVRLVDTIQQVRSAMRNVREDVLDVAAALSRVGMRDLAGELAAAVEHLPSVSSALDHAYTADMDSQLSHSSAIVGGMLKLALNGNLKPGERSNA